MTNGLCPNFNCRRGEEKSGLEVNVLDTYYTSDLQNFPSHSLDRSGTISVDRFAFEYLPVGSI